MMLNSTHAGIAERISKELGLSERQTAQLKTGSTLPDLQANFPHHFGKELEIVKGIGKSRRLFLKGDDECYSILGSSLHYVQDRWTLRPRTADMHTQWEYEIGKSSFLPLRSLVLAFQSVTGNRKNGDQAEQDQTIGNVRQILLGMPTKDLNSYAKLAQLLQQIEANGLKKWFDGAFIHALRLPPNSPEGEPQVWASKDQWRTMLAHIYRGTAASVLNLALAERPTKWSSPILDLNFSYAISLEIARSVLLAKAQGKKGEDFWDERSIYDYSQDTFFGERSDDQTDDAIFEWVQSVRSCPQEYLVLSKDEFAKAERFAIENKMERNLIPSDFDISIFGENTLLGLLDSLIKRNICVFGKPQFFY